MDAQASVFRPLRVAVIWGIARCREGAGEFAPLQLRSPPTPDTLPQRPRGRTGPRSRRSKHPDIEVPMSSRGVGKRGADGHADWLDSLRQRYRQRRPAPSDERRRPITHQKPPSPASQGVTVDAGQGCADWDDCWRRWLRCWRALLVAKPLEPTDPTRHFRRRRCHPHRR